MKLLNPSDTHDAIVTLKPVPEQFTEIKKQLDNMQFQIHHYPLDTGTAAVPCA
jgi:hypothetical protein